MLMVRNRFSPDLLDVFQREFSDLFDAVLAPRGRGPAFPLLNMWEADDALFADAELPGVSAENLDVQVVGDELTLKGRRTFATPEGAQFHRRERAMGEFTRIVKLPFEVDADNVEATFKNGVLTLRMPKAPAALARKITVKTG